MTICVRIRALTRFQEGVNLIFCESAIGHCEGDAMMLKSVLAYSMHEYVVVTSLQGGAMKRSLQFAPDQGAAIRTWLPQWSPRPHNVRQIAPINE